MLREDRITRKILDTIRSGALITEEEEKKEKEFPITKKTPHFSDVRVSQEEALLKTIGEAIELGEKALVYYPEKKDLVLSGKINAMKVAFQFRYNDPSGEGCYIWADALQLTETNNRTIGKIRDGYVNWKKNLVENGDLLEKLHKEASEED